MTNKLEILDGMCGTGKTTGIFKWILDNPEERYLYVTPFLDEVENRAIPVLSSLDFVYPDENKNTKMTKSKNLLEMLTEGRNIAFTHSLFKMMNKRHIEYIKKYDYTIIIDEECDLIEPFSEGYTHADIQYLISKESIKIDTEDLGKIIWIDADIDDIKEFKYSKFKNMCQLEMLYSAKKSYNCLTVHLPIGLIASAKRVVLMSYRFDHSIMSHFVQMKGLEVVPFTEVELQPFDKKTVRELIDIISFKNEKSYINTNILSSSWYENSSQKDLDLVGNIIRGISKNNKAVKKDVMWCSPSEYAIPSRRNGKRLNPTSFGAEATDNSEGCWISCSSKATNMYSHKWMLIHAFNRFPNQTLLSYLHNYGFNIDRDEFALSETIQWVWRSRIRNGEPIKLCFIPKRMKDLFVT